MRIKNRWNKRAKQKTLEEIAGALGFICWQISANGVLEIENQGYITDSNDHRLQIVAEFLAFLLQITDRLTYSQFSSEDRQRFIPALASHMADSFADNKHDLLGEGEHRRDFIDLLNLRATDYAEFDFNAEMHEASFPFLRYFGEQVASTLTEQKWISEYIVDIGGHEAVDNLTKSVKNLLARGWI